MVVPFSCKFTAITLVDVPHPYTRRRASAQRENERERQIDDRRAQHEICRFIICYRVRNPVLRALSLRIYEELFAN